MSTNTNMKQLLNIQDKIISFESNCDIEGIYKGNKYNFIEGKLSYAPTHLSFDEFKGAKGKNGI